MQVDKLFVRNQPVLTLKIIYIILIKLLVLVFQPFIEVSHLFHLGMSHIQEQFTQLLRFQKSILVIIILRETVLRIFVISLSQMLEIKLLFLVRIYMSEVLKIKKYSPQFG